MKKKIVKSNHTPPITKSHIEENDHTFVFLSFDSSEVFDFGNYSRTKGGKILTPEVVNRMRNELINISNNSKPRSCLFTIFYLFITIVYFGCCVGVYYGIEELAKNFYSDLWEYYDIVMMLFIGVLFFLIAAKIRTVQNLRTKLFNDKIEDLVALWDSSYKALECVLLPKLKGLKIVIHHNIGTEDEEDFGEDYMIAKKAKRAFNSAGIIHFNSVISRNKKLHDISKELFDLKMKSKFDCHEIKEEQEIEYDMSELSSGTQTNHGSVGDEPPVFISEMQRDAGLRQSFNILHL